ncbi:MAG: tetratricopeptide repeat protein [Planctomycetota bacterium]|nr:tetratricopeptide repeat protein [Planctomycetota bacterium]
MSRLSVWALSHLSLSVVFVSLGVVSFGVVSLGVVSNLASKDALGQEATLAQPSAAATDTPKSETQKSEKTSSDTEAGQEDLDAAMDMKVGANDIDKLSAVMDRCEAALKKGLGEYNTTFAKELLAGSALERAKMQIQEMMQGRMGQGAAQRLRKRVIADLEKATQNNPKLGEAFLLLAQIYKSEDLEKAIDTMGQAIDALEESPDKQSEAYLIRATMQEDESTRREDLQKAIDLDAKNRDAWRLMIAVMINEKDFKAAAEVAKKYLDNNPDDNDALGAYVNALDKTDRTAEALEVLTKKIKDRPEDPMLYAMRFEISLTGEKFDEAIADASKLIDLNGAGVEGYILRANARIQKAEVNKVGIDDELWALAKQDVDKSLDMKPGLAEAYRLRAVIASSQKKYDEAIQDLTILAQNKPNEPVFLLQLATLYQLDGRPGMAVKISDQLIRSKAGGASAYRIRGDAYLSMGDQAEAIVDFQSALDMMQEGDGQKSGLLNNLAWILATSPDDALRDGKRAIELGTKACEETEFKEAHILSTLAAGYAEVGNFEEAMKWSAKAVEIGKAESNEQTDQLQKELDSYRDKKPWREKQEVQEKKQPIINPSEAIET